MKKWEYRELVLSYRGPRSRFRREPKGVQAKALKKLNDLGAVGWEAVAIGATAPNAPMVVLLKRELSPPPARLAPLLGQAEQQVGRPR